MTKPFNCDCGGRLHSAHFICPERCAGGHLFVAGRGWQRCNHNGTTSPYDVPLDQRHAQAAHQAVAVMRDFLDAKQRAAGEQERIEEQA